MIPAAQLRRDDKVFLRWSPDEVVTLPNPKSGWQGLPLAEIRLARAGAAWVVACAICQDNGSGFAERLGEWTDLAPKTRHPSRDAALDAAACRIKARAEDPRIAAWLAALNPQQMELFA